jgi:hypothetical protein
LLWLSTENLLQDGEIDILEGVHDNEHNQVTWHTLPGCYYDANQRFSGTPVVSSQDYLAFIQDILTKNSGYSGERDD